MIEPGWYNTKGRAGPETQKAYVCDVGENGAFGWLHLKAINEWLVMCWDDDGYCKIDGLTHDPDFHLDLSGVDISKLKEGDIVRNIGTGNGYVITGNYGDTAIATRTVTVTNPTEWEKVNKEA